MMKSFTISAHSAGSSGFTTYPRTGNFVMVSLPGPVSQPSQKSKVALTNTDRLQIEQPRIYRFLDKLYLATKVDKHRAVAEALEFFDEELYSGRFHVCDLVFAEADPRQVHPSGIVAMLMATLRAREKLPGRKGFLDRAITALSASRGRVAAESLLEKYR